MKLLALTAIAAAILALAAIVPAFGIMLAAGILFHAGLLAGTLPFTTSYALAWCTVLIFGLAGSSQVRR